MKYPTWKQKGYPTPVERLMICDVCQKAEWHMHGWPAVIYCTHSGRTAKQSRMREGTKKEYAEAKAAIEVEV
jgi:hypothetical protein